MNRVVAAAAAAVLLFMTGCAGPAAAAPAAAGSCAPIQGRALAVVQAQRENSAAPSTAQLRRWLVDYVRGIPASEPGAAAGPPLVLVTVDGRPAVAWRQQFVTYGATDEAADFDRQTFLAAVDLIVRDMRAAAPEADVLEALAVAGRAVTEAGSGTVVLVDSGLATAGYLDFTRPGMLDATPEDVVAYLRANDALPPLAGLSVVLALGRTADPQTPLGPHYRKRVFAIWEAVATAAGACVTRVDDESPPAPTAAGLHPVTEITIPGPPPPPSGCSTVLADAGPLAFIEGHAEFYDPVAARRQLESVAAALLAQDCPTLMLTGTTAHWHDRDDEPDYHTGLGRRRAERVAADLVLLRVPAERLLTRGVGYAFASYVPDNDAQGRLVPHLAQQNRTVRIEPCTPQCPAP